MRIDIFPIQDTSMQLFRQFFQEFIMK